MKRRIVLLTICLSMLATSALASGYGVFTQGASGLGQANAVVAHPTGPSSLYFNPALLNDVPGSQVEIGTTAVISERNINLDSGGNEKGNETNFPSTLYYTFQSSKNIAAGIGIFFPFGLSNKWGNDYEGRYLGTSGEMTSFNINPALSYRITDQLSLAAGLDMVYVDTELKSMVNQSAVGTLLPPDLGGPLAEILPDVEQNFSGEGWGYGFNLGALFKATDRVSIGMAYRSKVDVDLDGDLSFANVDPRLTLLLPNSIASAGITLPAQFTTGIAFKANGDLLIEVGARWEDWDANDKLFLDVEFGTDITQIRNWHSTWAYNIGANYKLSEKIALNFGYLYGENAVPDSTFEPIIPDSDAHLFTIGSDLTCGSWTLSGAFGYEYHDSRNKTNPLGDPFGTPGTTANGEYDTDIYLVGLSLGYKF